MANDPEDNQMREEEKNLEDAYYKEDTDDDSNKDDTDYEDCSRSRR